MIYIRKLFTQDLRDGKQIAFPKEPSYDFFKFDYQNNEADRHIEFIFEPENSTFKQFEGKKIETRLYAAGSESRIDGELKAFIRDEIKIEVDDLVVFKSDGRTNNKFKFNVILKTDNEYPLYMKIIDSANHTLIETESIKHHFEKIDKPHNRIIFGAPGTGKSHQLKTELSNFPALTDVFQRNGKLEKLITEEIQNKPADGNNGDWAASVAIKYSFYFKELENWFNSQGPGGAYNDFLNRTFGLSAKQPELMVAAYRGMNLNRKTIFTETYERVTFHPNYSYAQFVGTYKPITKKNSDKTEIEYEFVPGPFLRTFIKAYKTKVNCLLLIEEINRANVAAVFGDVFQLLDRDENGESEYPITTSEDLRNFLAKPENLGGVPEDYTTISLPSNMYIWATMNSADQGVLPMDAAFKRRWEFEYININDGASELGDVKIPIPNGINEDKSIKYIDVEWNKLRMAINEQLKKVSGVNEDKLLGPFFIGDKDKIANSAKKPEQFCKSFKSKVLMYLFEDVVKMQPSELFNSKEDENVHYSDICKDYDTKGLRIFVKAIYEQFSEFANGDSE